MFPGKLPLGILSDVAIPLCEILFNILLSPSPCLYPNLIFTLSRIAEYTTGPQMGTHLTSLFSAPASCSTKLLLHNSSRRTTRFCQMSLEVESGFCERKRFHPFVYLKGSSSWPFCLVMLSKDQKDQFTEVLE